ncbi:hypothetical protein L1987_63771 [Smallanthus sonchifolius]|uniref:Uncharacterized protein n=1 Tax=Smallanthus sonchifolius TaxID=185202 RepID=A0ACB9CE94_9ASTR|nr:hypothetical protein L1987_63771 [Smallanthus sonchifolius]
MLSATPWLLLTPPGTPLFPSSDGKESQPPRVTARSKSSVRSSSVNKTSRLSVSQSESNYPSTRPTRSSSATRSSISTTQYTNYSNRNTNILNTSSASVSSYIRPSTPIKRLSTSARPSTPSATRTTPSRGSTPSRTRPSPAISSTDRTTRPSQTTRPLTPSSRPQTPGNVNSQTCRPASRPSTPTRKTQPPSLSPFTTSGGRGLSSNPRTVGSGSGSRPSSPSSRVRQPPQPINLHDFSSETPPNLRTTLPDRPLSAGRSRPSASKGSLEASNTNGSITRRHSSPIVTRGRVVDPTGRGRSHGNGHVMESLEPRRTSHLPESLTKKPVKSLNSEISTGFGRNISKKSLDMAIKHMDIRNGSARALSGSTIFPQSIRSSNTRTQPGRTSSAPGSIEGSTNNGYLWNRSQPTEDQSPHSSKLSSEADIYESSRYDAILLKEDLKNTSWLHSADDNIDDGLLFDNGFEPLPEPFGPL